MSLGSKFTAIFQVLVLSMVLLSPFICHPKVLPTRHPKDPTTESRHRQGLWACLWRSGSVQRPSKPSIPVDPSCSLRPPLPTHRLHPKLPLAPPATLLPTLKAPTEPRIPSLLNFSFPTTPCS